jgi:hypothetical protein
VFATPDATVLVIRNTVVTVCSVRFGRGFRVELRRVNRNFNLGRLKFKECCTCIDCHYLFEVKRTWQPYGWQRNGVRHLSCTAIALLHWNAVHWHSKTSKVYVSHDRWQQRALEKSLEEPKLRFYRAGPSEKNPNWLCFQALTFMENRDACCPWVSKSAFPNTSERLCPGMAPSSKRLNGSSPHASEPWRSRAPTLPCFFEAHLPRTAVVNAGPDILCRMYALSCGFHLPHWE